MSAADGLVRNEEVAGATPATLTILRKAGRYELAAPVLKTGSARAEVGALPTPSAILAVFQQSTTTVNERKSHETGHPLSKPIALSQELQTDSCHSHPNADEAERCFSSHATVWFETATGTRLVAQKQSPRLITGRRRSVTCRDDQPSLAELRLGEPSPRVAEED